MLRLTLLAFAIFAAAFAQANEVGVYDSAGKLLALIHDGARIPVKAGFIVRFEGGLEVEIQPHDQRSPITREGNALAWKGTTTLPNGAAIDFDVAWTEKPGQLGFTGKLHYGGGRRPLIVESAQYVIDLPREQFAGGRLTTLRPHSSDDYRSVPLSIARPAGRDLSSGQTSGADFIDSHDNWRIGVKFAADRDVSITDYWQNERSYRVRIGALNGLWAPNTDAVVSFDLVFSGKPAADAAALAVDPTKALYPFDGFGANYCWATDAVVTAYTLDNLKLAWSRHELKAIAWDREREKPGDLLIDDFKRIQRIQKMGVPWIISAWRVPERFYTDPDTKPPGTFGRRIEGSRWDELLELFGSYLRYLKKNYGAEPDLFSFNEPDLGVDIGFSPEAHRDAIKRIGAYLSREGFKTRLLLGDTANPRDSHAYVLATAADPAALKFVGAVSFHSWGNGSPAQYAAWSEVAHWLKLPLLVGEQGLDPGAWRNRNYDSFDYGLREVEQTQNLLRYAQPQSALYWQYTSDYALARVGGDGKAEPTGRFWMMKQLTGLTPLKSSAVASRSDRDDVLISAFSGNGRTVVHILNLGPKRTASLTGLPGKVHAYLTTESAGLQEEDDVDPASLTLQARSLTTLVQALAP